MLFKYGDCLVFSVMFLYTQLCLHHLYQIYCNRFLNLAVLGVVSGVLPVVGDVSNRCVAHLVAGSTGRYQSSNQFLKMCVLQHIMQYLFGWAFLFRRAPLAKDIVSFAIRCVDPTRRSYAFRVSESAVTRLYRRPQARFLNLAYRVLFSKLLVFNLITARRRRMQLQHFLRRYVYRQRLL